MNDFWLKLKIWTKVGLFVVIAIFLLIFVVKNDNTTVEIWFVHGYTTTVLRLLFVTFLFGVVVTLLVRTTIRTLQQISELRDRSRAQRMERDLAQMKTQVPTQAPSTPTAN